MVRLLILQLQAGQIHENHENINQILRMDIRIRLKARVLQLLDYLELQALP